MTAPRFVMRAHASALFVAALLWSHTDARARIQPYYVLTGQSLGQVRPKVLIMLDTSNSMHRGGCTWDDCEVTNAPGESRISVARRTLKTFIGKTQGIAEFALMTFGLRTLPTTVPAKCDHADGIPRRFIWVRDKVGVPINRHPGITGTWAMCSDRITTGISTSRTFRYLYPYLRSDRLGIGSVIPAGVANPSDPVPPSPLISMAPSDLLSVYNARRKIQWFPRYLGTRVNLNDTTDPGEVMLAQTIGDYGTTLTAKRNNVKNWDYYYWPYVDGFPGYNHWVTTPDPTLGYTDTEYNAGVMGGDGTANTLMVPFYIGDETVGTPPPVGAEGPKSQQENLDILNHLFDKVIYGGLDPHSRNSTPLAASIGVIPATVPNSNDYDGQDTVAGYLKYLYDAGAADVCRPAVAIVMTDAEVSIDHTAEVAAKLSEIRKQLGARVYVVGMYIPTTPDAIAKIHNMACGGAGACPAGSTTCYSPCDGAPEDNWDTCADATDPTNACADIVDDAVGIAASLEEILDKEMADQVQRIGSGPVSQLVDIGQDAGGERVVQSKLHAYTEYPGWNGHIVREVCTDPDPETPSDPTSRAPWCRDPDVFTPAELAEPTFGPCPPSRNWDAGECLQQKTWLSRRIYSSDPSGNPYIIYFPGALRASGTFRDELIARGLIPNDGNAMTTASAFAEFLKGKDWPNDWKLPGLAKASPVLVRRIPEHDATAAVAVGIRDPHCAGRGLPRDGLALPASLSTFAQNAWDPAQRISTAGLHHEYQEAVLAGDDLGVMHAFHYRTGNEMWGYIPPFMLDSAFAQFQEGAATMGQPDDVASHHYGISATPNQGWVYDTVAARWRHLVVFGFGAGGNEYVALDLSHASPYSPSGPFEVLWTTEDTALKADYDLYNGQTWARPALTYRLPTGQSSDTPEALLVMAGGYPDSGSQGRWLMLVDALTGVIREKADLRTAPASTRWDGSSFGLTPDPVVATHCNSRFWGEMEEVYEAGPGGRLFRWDQGWDGTARQHESDSADNWVAAGRGRAFAYLVSCQGTGQDCNAITGTGSKREPFAFSPAVSGLNRIDSLYGAAASGDVLGTEDQFLIALASGTPFDDAIDGGDPSNAFHSSLWLLRDDHRVSKRGGLAIPSAQPAMSVSQIGDYPGYLRLAVTDLTRTRVYTPFAGSPTYTETARFRKATRPIRSPRIAVNATGVQQGAEVDLREDVEVYTITYTLFEPAQSECDARWFDATNKEWHLDEGAVYEVTFRLTASDVAGFDFQNGAGAGAGFSFAPGLTLVGVEQVTVGDCADGVCGPQPTAPHHTPCGSGDAEIVDEATRSLSLATMDIRGFAPAE